MNLETRLDPQISQMDTDYQGILHFVHFTLRVKGSQVRLICNSLYSCRLCHSWWFFAPLNG